MQTRAGHLLADSTAEQSACLARSIIRMLLRWYCCFKTSACRVVQAMTAGQKLSRLYPSQEGLVALDNCSLGACREQQGPTIDDIIDELGKMDSSELKELEKRLDGLEEADLEEMEDPENAVIPQEAGMGRSRGLQAIQPAKPLIVTAAGMQDMEDFHLKVCTMV